MKILQVQILILLLVSPSWGQEQWPEYRGPAGEGKAPDHKIPKDLSTKSALWATPVHGKGWSSPVIWNEQVWLTTATDDGTKMSAICLDLESGKVIHDLLIHENESPAFCHPTNSYASPTPVIDEDRVFLHFGSYGTTCLDTTTGKKVWQRLDLECDHFRGPASSPILFENLLIVAFDGADFQYVVALDSKTGETVWKTDREIDYGTDNGDLKKAYGTGNVFEIGEIPVLIYPSAVATIAYHARTGKQLWIAYHEGMNASARPLRASNGLVVLTNGMGRMIGLDPNGKGDITNQISWTQTKSIARKSSQVLVDDLIYMNGDKGVISCFDSATGQPKWQKRVGGAFAASPVYDGESLLSLSEQGDVLIYKASPGGFEPISKTKFPDGFKSSPAVARGKMILRSFSTVYCFDAKR